MIDRVLIANGLNSEEMEKFKSDLKQRDLKKGDYFISSEQVSRNIAFIESGYLRTFHLDENGHEITTEFNQPDTFCGSYYSFYTHEPSFEFIEAITDCELLLLSYNSLQKLYAESYLVNVFGRTILEKACVERDLRLKKILHLKATEKYEWFLENYADIYKVSKLADIASFLGIKPETLSRVRRKIIS
jgi:CRP-like cAMP-binding protein